MKITERMGYHHKWYLDAEKMTMEELPEFLRHLVEDYEHDYGTICHALAAGSLATTHAMNKTEQGGITGFQSGAIMWEFIRHWGIGINGPMQLIRYENMLYPQYWEYFTTISESTWKWLQREAKRKLKESPDAHPDIKAHWEKIVNGKVPFGYVIKGQHQ